MNAHTAPAASETPVWHKTPMFRFLMVLTISSTVGVQAYMMLFNNFAVETVGLSGKHIGILQSVREFPGLLAFLAIFILRILQEHRLSALSVLLLGVGVLFTGMAPFFSGLVFTTLVMSFGFHYYETTNQSLTLQYFDTATSPKVFGRLRSMAAASNIAAGILILALSHFFSYSRMYVLVGAVVILAAIWGFSRNPAHRHIVPQRKKMVFRKKYSLFYFLTFMSGARRQIFMSFAVLLLVQKFHFTVREVAVLFVVNNTINFFLSPLIGRAIIRFGERRVLSLEYISLIAVFIAYAAVDSKALVIALYILDHVFFNFSIAIRTYFQKVADPKDVAPSMAVGFTINHIAAVVLPAIGGFLWMVDYRIPFWAGAAMSMISLVATQQIRKTHHASTTRNSP
jgi:predicted MFS family arabinose efflux permease